jgi:phosphoribosylformylglycinamidine cyclo-ligase
MPDPTSPLSYEAAGVNYDVLDSFKRACQKEAAATVPALARHGASEPAGVRGESCYLIETPDSYIAHVEEALGTKVMAADAMFKLTGKSFYRNVAVDDVSTIVNDLCASGALPLSVAMYAAVGDDEFFSDKKRSDDLAAGFAEGCRLSGAVWSGGETQTLKGMIAPGTCVLGGSAIGVIKPKTSRIPNEAAAGDAIVLLSSSGVQTNGLTLCRALAERMPKGYLTPISDGRAYGEALLDPSVIYVNFVRSCQEAGLRLKYCSHMTGHGWRKLMRLSAPLVYRIEALPPVPPVFDAIRSYAGLDQKEMYGTFNMGAGWAAFVAREDAERCASIARSAGYQALVAGSVALETGADGKPRKAVEIAPLGITFEGTELNIR